MMNVPLLDLNQQNSALEDELTDTFKRVLRSGQFILGPEVQKFEKQVAEMIGTRHALGVTSGTDAILLALMALDIGAGDEVICPSFTFFATAGCISRVGAKPVFVDACPVCFNLEVSDVKRRITSRTKAIIPVHLFGQAASMNEIMALAAPHKIAVIEDAAQSLGARYRGQAVGTLGTFGTFSFFPSKNLGGFGDSGMLVCNDDALAERARLLRTHGAQPKYFHKLVGGNFRIDALQAALLAVKLPHLPEYIRQRQVNAARYTERLSSLPGVVRATVEHCTCCGNLGRDQTNHPSANQKVQIVLPVARVENEHIWNQYTLRVLGNGQRDALKLFLTERHIGTEVYYPVPMHAQECFAALRAKDAEFGNTNALARECLSLPVYPELSEAQQDDVIEAIARFLQRQQS